MTDVLIVSRATWAHLKLDDLPKITVPSSLGCSYVGALYHGMTVVRSDHCPTWTPEPTRLRRFMRARLNTRTWGRLARWVLRVERRGRVIYKLTHAIGGVPVPLLTRTP